MGVIADVIFTVAVISAATGAVAEFQIRMGHIGSSADGTPVGVGRLGSGGGSLVGTGIEADHLGLILACLLLFEQTGEVDPPGSGDHIQHILAEEQEVVGKRNDAEQIAGEGKGDQINDHDDQIKQGEDPCLHRDHEEKQEVGVGVHGGIGQEQAQIQIGDTGIAAEDQTVNVHQHHTGEIEEIEFQRAPEILHGSAERVVAQQGNGGEDQAAGIIGQRIGDQTPHFTPEDPFPAEVQQIIQKVIAGHGAHQIDHGAAQGNVEHQIGDTLVPVAETKKIKFSAKVFQIGSSP